MNHEGKLASFLAREREGIRFCALFALFTVLVSYYFFDLMGRGFFALLIYLGLIALGWRAPAAVHAAAGGATAPAGAGSSTNVAARRRE